MLCFFVRRLVQAHLGDALRARDAERLRRHCERCAPCAAAVRQAEETARLVASLPRRALSGDEASALLARVRSRGRERLGERLLGTPAPLPMVAKPLAVRVAERWDALKHEATLLGFRVFARPAALPACAAVPVAALLLVMLHRGTPSPETVATIGEPQGHLEFRTEAGPVPAAGAPEPGHLGALRPPAPNADASPSGDGKAAAPVAQALKAPPAGTSRMAASDAPMPNGGRTGATTPGRSPQPLTPAAVPTAPDAGALRRTARSQPREASIPARTPAARDEDGPTEMAAAGPPAAPPPPAPAATSFGGERGIPPATAMEAPGGEPETREVPPAPAMTRAVPDALPVPAAERGVRDAAPERPTLEAAGAGGGGAGAPGRPGERALEGIAGGIGAPAPRAVPPAPAGQPTAASEAARSRDTRAGGAPGAQRTHTPSQMAKVPDDAAAEKPAKQSLRKDSRVASKPRGELIRLLGGESEEAQEAARELGRRGEKRAVDALGRLLRTHAEKEVRETAADALSAIGTREALALLRSVAEGNGPGKAAAARALERRR